jgi:hypothetical protein
MIAFLRGFLLLAGILTLLSSGGCSKSKNDITGKPNDEQDTTPPEAVIDLRAVTIGEYHFELRWTAPADSGEGCAAYDLRMAGAFITDSTFESAAPVEDVGHPQVAGESEQIYVGGLETDSTYFFALKTRDEDSNWSVLSNCLEVKTRLDSVVVLADSALERVLRLALNRPTGALRQSHISGLQAINSEQAGIKDLTGIGYCTNLRQVNLPRNLISDLAPLAELELLRIVNLIGNEVSSLLPLAGADNLEHVLISHNPVASVVPLGTCSKLTILRANDTQIRDFSAISNLPDLEVVNVAENELSDLEFAEPMVKLTELRAETNQISDLSPLARLSNLKVLIVYENHVADLTPLRNLTSIEFLDLSDNDIVDLAALLQNPGLNQGDYLILRGNLLSEEAQEEQVPLLRSRGVNVSL